jgi:hypothetical protein
MVEIELTFPIFFYTSGVFNQSKGHQMHASGRAAVISFYPQRLSAFLAPAFRQASVASSCWLVALCVLCKLCASVVECR